MSTDTMISEYGENSSEALSPGPTSTNHAKNLRPTQAGNQAQVPGSASAFPTQLLKFLNLFPTPRRETRMTSVPAAVTRRVPGPPLRRAATYAACRPLTSVSLSQDSGTASA
jgi:hypothetical protein